MTDQSFETMRRAMVASQLRTTAVNDPRVVRAMGDVPRERHVPADKAALAYADIAVLLGNGRALNPAMATGRLLTEAHVRSGERVLVVGAATGYATAVLRQLGAIVTAVEDDAALADIAAAAGVPSQSGPLEAGWPSEAPYDLIFIDGAVESIPQVLVDQLAEGGRLAGGIVDSGVVRLAIGRKAAGSFGMIAFADAEAVRLPGFAPAPAFTF